MKHSIRQRVLDPVTGLKVTKIETVNGELGSGIFDKNGREIFENDRVQVDVEGLRRNDETGFDELKYSLPADGLTEIVYQYGEFVLMWDVDGGASWNSLVEFAVIKNGGSYLEVIGHVDD